MRQLTCTGPDVIGWCDVPEPAVVRPTDALVRPIAVARCAIDPTLVAMGPTRAERFALGHEAVVEIVETGAEVSIAHVGMVALPSFWISCGSCARCVRGKTAMCSEVPLLANYGMEPLSGVEYGGMLSDLVRVPYADAMLTPLAHGLDPIAVASLPDNVVDGYRLVAPHLARHPGADVVVASHGGGSIALYAALSAVALAARTVTFASDDEEALAMAERVGAVPLATNFNERPPRTWPIVADCGPSDQVGFHWSMRATEPEGVLHCMGSIETEVTINLMRLYTLGIEFHIGRAHSAALLPEVMSLVAAGGLHPEIVTTDVIAWDEAPDRYLDPSMKLIVQRVT